MDGLRMAARRPAAGLQCAADRADQHLMDDAAVAGDNRRAAQIQTQSNPWWYPGRRKDRSYRNVHASSRLPKRLPVGTKYVVESAGALVRRFVELPSGEKILLPTRKALRKCADRVSLVPDQAPRRRSKVVA
jgi:hypothetical protein